MIKVRPRRFWIIVMFSLFVLAFCIRAGYTRKGLPYIHHWDEPWITSIALSMLTTGDLNPHFFNWGSLPMYLSALVDIPCYMGLMGKAELSGLWDIQAYSIDNGVWEWTLSHPQFLQANRLLTALFGAGSVVLCFLIATSLGGRLAGVLAAMLLAVAAPHVQNSAYVTPDIPVLFFMLCVFHNTTLFLRKGMIRHFILALVFCGMAAAVKYNGAIVTLAPAFSLFLLKHNRPRRLLPWLIAALFIIPTASFLLSMPYAILDLKNFLYGLGHNVRHYKVVGHPGLDPLQGWAHFAYQIAEVQRNFAHWQIAFAYLGAVLLLRKRLWLPVFVASAVYFYLMSQMIVTFPRNFFLLYPLFCICFGYGIASAVGLGIRLTRRYTRYGRIAFRAATFMVVAYALILFIPAIRQSHYQWNKRDTRSLAIDALNTRASELGITRLGIPSIFQFHELDLKRLKIPYTIGHFHEMIEGKGDCDAVLVPSGFSEKQTDKPELTRLRKWYETLLPQMETVEIMPGGPLDIRVLSVNPAVMVSVAGKG